MLEKGILKIESFRDLCDLSNHQNVCGVTSKKYNLKKNFGVGLLQLYEFEGLHISIFDLQLRNGLSIQGNTSDSFFELNYLIEGEKIIKVENVKDDIVLEHQESYLVYINKLKGSVHYAKNKHVKELKIRMSSGFIKRHQLDLEFDIINKYDFSKINLASSIKPQCSRTQNIISKIFENKQQGLLKRLFLESKVLELVGIQLSNEEGDHVKKVAPQSQPNKTVKKLYEIQHLISSDLTKQYSIKELSKHIGVNDFVLKKEFKRVFGKTTFEYATELRMKKAKELLLHSKKAIYEISEIVGYKNPTHFTAAFKKNEGVTPKKFRDIN